MKNLWKVCVILALVAVIGAPVWAQNPAARMSLAQQLGHPVPLVPTVAAGHARPHIWVSGKVAAKPATFTLPWFCNGGDGGYMGFCPNAMVAAYNVNKIVGGNGGAGMTIGIVDAYYYANAEADLGVFNSYMGLPACTTNNGCFKMVDQYGNVAGGPANSDWEVETMLDIEWAHAMAPNAKILLVHAASDGDDLFVADVYAYGHADIVSNSWSGGEWSGETSSQYDGVYEASPVPVLFSSGDYGEEEGTQYPCASPWVTCVGGTSLYVNAVTFQRTSEVGWSCTGAYGYYCYYGGSAGGCSTVEPIPAWQGVATSACGSYRGTPDVAADADPNTGVWMYDSGNYPGEFVGMGGTSLACPLTAGIYANINTARKSFGKAKFGFMNPVLYQAATNNYPYFYFDVLTGWNGAYAGPGYDLVTGLGVSNAPAMGNRFFGLIYNP